MKVYEGGLVATQMLVDSVKAAATIRRLVYTSSCAAVGHPADEGYRYREDSWTDMNQERRGETSGWNMETVARNREVAYAMTKVETERYVYSEAESNGFTAFGMCPCHVIGPLLSKTHQPPWAWQTRIGDMLEGFSHSRMNWNIVGVRDVAEAQRLVAECSDNRNSEPYNLVATDESGLKKQEEIQELLRALYPGFGIGGNFREGRTYRATVAFLEQVITQLKLQPHTPEQAIKDNADSLLAWGTGPAKRGSRQLAT